MLADLSLVAIVTANVVRLARDTGRSVELPDDPTLVDLERVAEVLGVPAVELLRPL